MRISEFLHRISHDRSSLLLCVETVHTLCWLLHTILETCTCKCKYVFYISKGCGRCVGWLHRSDVDWSLPQRPQKSESGLGSCIGHTNMVEYADGRCIDGRCMDAWIVDTYTVDWNGYRCTEASSCAVLHARWIQYTDTHIRTHTHTYTHTYTHTHTHTHTHTRTRTHTHTHMYIYVCIYICM